VATTKERQRMPKYVLAYHGGGMEMDEAAMAKVMERWDAWFAELGDAVVDGGNPVAVAKTISPDGSVSEGGGANPISGYSLITAVDIDAAVSRAKGCPVLETGGSVEVAETIDM
jgi:hypothetical protein